MKKYYTLIFYIRRVSETVGNDIYNHCYKKQGSVHAEANNGKYSKERE